MSEHDKVVNFPKSRAPRRAKTDADHVREIKRAWHALARTIRAAQNSGLSVNTGEPINFYCEPKVTRTYK